jgi:hypothetical protein
MEQHARHKIERHMQACAPPPVLGDYPYVADPISLQTLLG